MGFLTEAESAAIRLIRMSLHVVGGDEEFEPQPQVPIDHEDFILSILRDIANDFVYSFTAESLTKNRLEEIAQGKLGFEEGAQQLARDFARFKQARDGAFFVFELEGGEPDGNLRFFALIKYDYSQALEIVHQEGTQRLRRIVEAFVNNKSAIQKSAIVRVRDGKAEDGVSTRDRMGRPAPNLTDFFAAFLEVKRHRSDLELTQDVKGVVKSSLEDNMDLIPEGQFASAMASAIDVLRNSPRIDEEVIAQAVWVGVGRPGNEDILGKLQSSSQRHIRLRKLTGVSFAPVQAALPRALRRKVKTAEGVTIEYDTRLEGEAINRTTGEDGTTRFVITTRRYSDAVVSDTPR